MTTSDEQEHIPAKFIPESLYSSFHWRLKLSETWHAMSQVLGLRRLQEFMQGSSNLSDEPVWLLGLWYGLHNKDDNTVSLPPEIQDMLMKDFGSKFWFTYRRDFSPIEGSCLTSDVGWGCTIRSGQMMMAEALARSWWGRTANLSAAGPVDQAADVSGAALHIATTEPVVTPASAVDAGVMQQAAISVANSRHDESQLIRLFVDEPSQAAVFSIHNLCKAGAQHGVVAGQWLGPWVLCKALAAAAGAATDAGVPAAQDEQQQLHHHHHHLGFHVHVVCDPGGGAPTLVMNRLKALLCSQCDNTSQPQHQEESSSTAAGGVQQQPVRGLLILIPLTLGVGKVDERYLPQLSQLLTNPQTVGIVGGRPGASLYFMGTQGSSIIYLDPHEVQQAPTLPEDLSTFHCCTPRLMPLAAIDPSLAIGFYCSTIGDLEDLGARLRQLAHIADGAPLLTVVDSDEHSERTESNSSSLHRPDNHLQAAATGEDWEFV